MLVSEIFAAPRCASFIASDWPNKIQSGGSKSTGSVPVILFGFSGGIFSQRLQRDNEDAQGWPMGERGLKPNEGTVSRLTHSIRMTYMRTTNIVLVPFTPTVRRELKRNSKNISTFEQYFLSRDAGQVCPFSRILCSS